MTSITETKLQANSGANHERNVRRFVTAAYSAINRGRWDVAAECFNRAHQECLIAAEQPRQDAPAPGALATGYRDLAGRATDNGAKGYWNKLAEEEEATA